MAFIKRALVLLLIALASAPAHATDTTDNQVLSASINNPQFQDRIWLRFINAAESVTTETTTLQTNATTATSSAVLHFASVPGAIVAGWTVTDLNGSGVIPSGATVVSTTATSVTLNVNVAGTGVGAADNMLFAPPSHAQRNAFAGALFANTVSQKMLAMAIVANATIRSEILAAPGIPGGNALDSDIDFQVNSIFTGLAVSKSW